MSFTAAAQPRTKTKKSNKTATSIRRRRSKFINVQRHASSCGPIAIANAIKWHGVETSYSTVLSWCKNLAAYHEEEGMWPYQMRYVLRTLRLSFKVRRKLTVDDLDKILGTGGSLILIYDTPRGGHAVFIDGVVDGGYRAWNRRVGDPPLFSKKDMESALKASSALKDGLYAYVFPEKKTAS